MESHHHEDGYAFSFQFSDPLFNCPDGSTEFGDFCYSFYANQLSWVEAEKECVDKWDGHLASIHEPVEQAFIEANIVTSSQPGGRVWIGFKDFGSNGEFQWADDTLRPYTNWAPGEPNNPIGGEQTCVEVYVDSGKWNDDDCAKGTINQYFYILTNRYDFFGRPFLTLNLL